MTVNLSVSFLDYQAAVVIVYDGRADMKLIGKKVNSGTSDIVLNRLKLILASDRACCQTYVISQMAEDIKKTLSKYTCIFDSNADIKVLHDKETQQNSLLVIKIPIGEINVKNN